MSSHVQILVSNKSTVVTDVEVQQMVQACSILLPSFANVWNTPATISFAGKDVGTSQQKTPTFLFVIVDTTDQADALAYHTEEEGKIEGFVFAKTIIENGGVVLHLDATTTTVASALFHEVAEALVDAFCNEWWTAANGTFYAAEVCDPVESNNVIVSLVDGTKVALSDFVFPAWRDTQAAAGSQFNYNNTLKAPFQLEKGGYSITIDKHGKTHTIFKEGFPEWKKELKLKYSHRNKKRTHEEQTK